MTREDILSNIKTRISCIESYSPEELALNQGILSELKDLLLMIEQEWTSLPSNLDEAAKEYANATSVKVWGRINPKDDLDGYMARSNYATGLLDGFKAGAEWMAGQREKAMKEGVKLTK